MIERVVRNDEVVGLIPICSTKQVSNGREPEFGRSLRDNG